MRGTSGNDLIRLASYSGAYTVEVINGNGGIDYIQGTTANNTLDFSTTVLTAIAEIRGEKGNDTIFGSQGADTIRGGVGNDTRQSNAGADIYVFARGDGVDTINDSGSSSGDKLLFEGAVAPEDIWLVKNGNHLDIYLLAGTEKVQIHNWQSSESAIEVIATEAGAELPLANIDVLAELMTAIGVPQNGVITLSGDQQAQITDARSSAWQ